MGKDVEKMAEEKIAAQDHLKGLVLDPKEERGLLEAFLRGNAEQMKVLKVRYALAQDVDNKKAEEDVMAEVIRLVREKAAIEKKLGGPQDA